LPAIITPLPSIFCTVPNINTNSDGNSVDFTAYSILLTCKTGFSGSPTYTCTGTTNPGTYTAGGTACSANANTCTVLAGTGYNQQSKSGAGTFLCDVAGYSGTISYSCPNNGGTVAGTGSCTANTCSVSAGNGYNIKTLLPVGSSSFPCNAGYTGTINYNCPSNGGTATIISGSCTASPIKCYAKDMLGFRGTNYLDTVFIDEDSQDIMYANIEDTRIHTFVGQSSMLLPLVNRIKLYDVYHGSLNYQDGDVVWAIYGAIDMSKFSQTSYTSAIKQYGSPGNYDIYGTHELTKYARILGYGTNTFACDYGFTGSLTYNCSVDGSTLFPSSGTCTQN
jgi:hypothetical protein